MCVSARSCSPATHCESSCIFEGQFSAFPHCSFYLFVNPIVTWSAVLVSPSRKPCLHPFLIAPFTFLSTLYSTYLQSLFHLSSPFPHCSFHLSVNPIFNLSTVLVSPSSKPNLHPFLITPFTFLSTLYSTYLQCQFHPQVSPLFNLSSISSFTS